MRSAWFLFIAILFAVVAWFTINQAPRPNTYAKTDFRSLDWWRYPLERNAELRLPQILGAMNDVFVLPETEKVWIAGGGGLILHSTDGGRQWQRQDLPGELTHVKRTAVTTRTSPPEDPINPTIDPRRQDLPGTPPPDTSTLVNQDLVLVSSERIGSKFCELHLTVYSPDRKPLSDVTVTLEGPDPQTGTTNPKGVLHLRDIRPGAYRVTVPLFPTFSQRIDLRSANVYRYHAFLQESPQQLPPPDDEELVTLFPDLTSIWFLDERQGWVAGEGLMLHTTDGGASWSILSRAVPAGFSRLYFADPQNGWGWDKDAGDIMKTTDGGRTWRFTATNALYLARGGWGIVDGNRLSRYALNRETNVHTFPASARIVGLDFIDETYGWALDDGGLLQKTGDGGRSWEEITRLPEPGHLHFLDQEEGWLINERGYVRKTEDGGKTWSDNLEARFEIETYAALDDNLLTVLKADDDLMNLQLLRGDSETWLPLSRYQEHLFVTYYFSGNRGYAGGFDGQLTHETRNGGMTWSPISSQASSYAFTNRTWLVIGGKLCYLNEQGRETPWPRAPDGTWQRVSFWDDLNGMLMGLTSMALTRDGGSTWERHALPDQNIDLTHLTVSFPDPQHGMIVGSDAFVTHDGGTTWQELSVENPISVFMFDEKRAWIIDMVGAIIATRDGGETWGDPLYLGTYIAQAWFLSETHGLALGG